MFDHIVALERTLDSALPRPRLWGRAPQTLVQSAEEWSAAVWDAAVAAGPLSTSTEDVDRGVALARRPAFVCGVHRSGTTLVRDLLDGHPMLSVLPSEGSFFANHERHLARLNMGERRAFLGREWLRRLANPINQPPFWTLGRSTSEQSPYVSFARAFLAWWDIVKARTDRPASWPLSAVALAYCSGHTNGIVPPGIVRWVEKTPTNEQFMQRIWMDFPAAKVIQIVRNPLDVLASRKRLEQRAAGAFENIRTVLDDLRASYTVAAEQLARGEADRYALLHFEDLVENPGLSMTQLALFLGVPPLPTLSQPTVGGLRAVSNSSFEPGDLLGPVGRAASPDRAAVLSHDERLRLAVVVADAAAAVGYAVPA